MIAQGKANGRSCSVRFRGPCRCRRRFRGRPFGVSGRERRHAGRHVLNTLYHCILSRPHEVWRRRIDRRTHRAIGSRAAGKFLWHHSRRTPERQAREAILRLLQKSPQTGHLVPRRFQPRLRFGVTVRQLSKLLLEGLDVAVSLGHVVVQSQQLGPQRE